MKAPEPVTSKIISGIRWIANRTLSDKARKRLKGVLLDIVSLPLKVLGVEWRLTEQKGEIERLKTRLFIADGKLNLALYGLPRCAGVEPSLQVGSLLPELKPPKAALAFWESIKPECSLAISQLSKTSKPKKAWIFGEAPGFDPHTFWEDNTHIIRCDTDPLTGLLAQCGAKLSLIGLFYTYPQMSPLEQAHWLSLAVESLEAGGVLAMEMRLYSNDPVVEERYWSDPKNLRPYSIKQIRAILDDEGALSIREFKLRSDSQSNDGLSVVLRKSS